MPPYGIVAPLPRGERGVIRNRNSFAADISFVRPFLRHMTYRARSLRRSATPAEQALWNALRRRKLGFKFRRQQPMGPYVVDFFCGEATLVIEIDGPYHIRQTGYDQRRDLWLKAGGLHVVHLTNDEVLHRQEESIDRIRQALVRVR